jgi:hypothetical protein
MKLRFVVPVIGLLITGCFCPSASAEGIDPVALQLARQLMETMHVSATTDQMVKQMMQAMGTGLSAANPGKGKEVQDLLSEVLLPEMSKLKPEMIDAAANIYAANFSADELKQILAYYQSDIGQKVISRLPTILQEQGRVAQQIVIRMMPDIQAKLEQAIKARGLNSPKGT